MNWRWIGHLSFTWHWWMWRDLFLWWITPFLQYHSHTLILVHP